MLDAKSAFDVVVHANLIRRLHQYEFLDQSILLINSLYENAVSHIKWKNLMSEQNFKIEEGVRQGGVLSADLYIFQKPSFVTIVLILDLTGRITLLAGCSWYPSRLLKSTAMSTIVCISNGKCSIPYKMEKLNVRTKL
jgi:hypothetical protein